MEGIMGVKSVDWKGLIETLGEETTKDTIDVLKKHKDLLARISKDELTLIMHHVATGGVEELNGAVYSAMLRQLTDEQFLALREKSVESAKVWAKLDQEKDAAIKDLTTKIGKTTANIIIRYLLLGGI